MKFGGPFQSQGPKTIPKFDFDVTASAAGQNISAGAISTGDKGFLKFQGSTYAVPDNVFQQFKTGFEQAQAKSGATKGSTPLSALGINPIDWVTDAQVKGDESIGGTDTTHISAQVDVGKFLDDINTILGKAGTLGLPSSAGKVPKSLTPAQKQQIEDAVKSASFDVWTGKDDKVLRKLAFALDIAVPAAQQSKVGGLKSAKISFQVTINDLNQPQTIATPTNAKDWQQLIDQFSGLIGGASGGSGSSSGSGSTTPPAGSGADATKINKYTACITKAGGDAAKAAKCADLLK